MKLSERTLRNWRRDALSTFPKDDIKDSVELALKLNQRLCESKERILKLTQELMDIHLIRKA